MAREPHIPCWWRPCRWSSVSEKAGWCCDWLQRHRTNGQENHTSKNIRAGTGRQLEDTEDNANSGCVHTRRNMGFLEPPRPSTPTPKGCYSSLLTMERKRILPAPESDFLPAVARRKPASPFVLSWPLLSSAPSIACPSAAKRSLRVSISLRTEK